jgi:hypothetical protein
LSGAPTVRFGAVDNAHWFRVEASVELAIDELGTHPAGLQPIQARRLAVEARQSLDRLSTRRDAEVRQALGLVLDAVETLEREVELLQRRNHLRGRGLALRPVRARIGGDGMWIEESHGSRAVLLHLGLRVAGAYHLVSTQAELRPKAGGTELRWVEPDPSVQDLLVGFVFEQQRKERRRELDALARS